MWLTFHVLRRRGAAYPGAGAALGAVVVGCLTFLPWVPVLLFQSRHTGTPWAGRPTARAIVNAFSSLGGGTVSGGHVLAGILLVLCALGLLDVRIRRRPAGITWSTRPRGRPLAFVVTATLALAVSAGYLTDSAYDGRYVSIVLVPYVLLAALGLSVIRDRRVRVGVLGLAVVIGLGGSLTGVSTQRTQAGEIARALHTYARPGDVIGYCPDQLGPAVDRLLPAGRYAQITFPRGTGPAFVNWEDYAHVVAAASPTAFAGRLGELARGGHQIFLVWQPGYASFATRCEGILHDLQHDPAFRATAPVGVTTARYFEPMWLVRFTPVAP